MKRKTFGLSIKKTSTQIISDADDAAPQALLLVDQEIDRGEPNLPPAPVAEETPGIGLESEARELAGAWQSSRQLRQPFGEGGLSTGSNVDDMRERRKTLGAHECHALASSRPRKSKAGTSRIHRRRRIRRSPERMSAAKSRTFRISHGVLGA